MAFQASSAVCIVLRSCRYNEWGRAAASFQMARLNTDQGHSFFFTAYYTEDEVRECENLRSEMAAKLMSVTAISSCADLLTDSTAECLSPPVSW